MSVVAGSMPARVTAAAVLPEYRRSPVARIEQRSPREEVDSCMGAVEILSLFEEAAEFLSSGRYE
jgi:hypothetical protein